jgi:integrase
VKGFIVRWRDATGRMGWQTVATLAEAKLLRAKMAQVEQQPRRAPTVSATITVADYFAEFLRVHGVSIKARTRAFYQDQLTRYIAPTLGPTRVRALTRGQVKRWLADLRGRGLARDTVRNAYAALHRMLNAAVEDELIGANPASTLGRALALLAAPKERTTRIKAMTREQLTRFLATMQGPTARPADRAAYPFFLTLARTGLRLGEAFALQPEDLDLEAGTLRVERAFSGSRLETPKTAASIREVDLSPELAGVLHRLVGERRERCLEKGFTEPWLFLSSVGTRLRKENTERLMTRLIRRAGLPHFTPHDLRHTFASLLLQRGENPKYVQQQLGHSSLALTTDLYGKWLRAQPTQGGVAALDAPVTAVLSEVEVRSAEAGAALLRAASDGQKPVGLSAERECAAPRRSVSSGAPGRDRTAGLQIRSPPYPPRPNDIDLQPPNCLDSAMPSCRSESARVGGAHRTLTAQPRPRPIRWDRRWQICCPGSDAWIY